MLLMHKETARGSRAGVEILVAAPDSGVDVPVVEMEGDVANRVSEVENDKDAMGVCVLGDGGDVEELTAVVLDAREEKDGGGRTVFSNSV